MEEKLLEIKNLKTYFFVESGTQTKKKKSYHTNALPENLYKEDKTLRNKIPVKAVDGVSFDIYKGEVLGIVGESGSGKSVTAYSIIRLIPDPPGKIVEGEIIYNGVDLLKLSYDEIRKYRGKEIAMIFQEPLTSLNPVMKIGKQISEVIQQHENLSEEESIERVVEILEQVGIPDAKNRMNDYPHNFSGGMRQRVMIAMALVCNPRLLIADEPTTALDVTIQAQILELMMKIKNTRKESSVLLITHNLGVVAEICDRVIVMYGGKIQECGTVTDIFENPRHPYTEGLLNSLPDPYKETQGSLFTIPGVVPDILELPEGCKFCTRCGKAIKICGETEPELLQTSEKHFVRCHLYLKEP